MREKHYKINSAGQEFIAVLGNKVIEIYYNDKEISDYLKQGFVPNDNETFTQLEERIDQAIKHKNILLAKKKKIKALTQAICAFYQAQKHRCLLLSLCSGSLLHDY